MCINYYLEILKGKPNTWLIDTCTIVKHWKLSKFIDKKKMLLDAGVKITVLKTVYEELLRLQDSRNEIQARDVIIGFKLVENNQDLFEIQGYNQETRCDEAFADKEIYRKLAADQNDLVQLLITDDLNLAYDAYMLNNRKSFSTNRIFVCWINEEGELQRSKGAHEEKLEPITKIEKEVEIREVEKEVIKPVEVEKTVIKKVYIKEEKKWYEKHAGWAVTGAFGLIAGYLVCENKDMFYSLLLGTKNGLQLAI